MAPEKDFYKTKKLKKLSKEEWELLCDGCGLCCFRKFITGYGKKSKIIFTKIACNFLDLNSCLCKDYDNRFCNNKECINLTYKKLKKFKWLPETCAYRRLYENKFLPPWHPLITGIPVKDNPDALPFLILDGVHEKDVSDWEEFIVEEK